MRKALKYLFYTLNALALLLLMASAFSDRISPHEWILPSFLGFLFPFFLSVNLLFLVVWIFSSGWKAALCNIAFFLMVWGSIRTYCPINPVKEKMPEKTIKLMTYNVMGFAYKNHTEEEPNPILEYVAGEDADIVCFQEYFVNKKNRFLDQPTVSEALKNYPYRKFVYFDNNKFYQYGLAVYSKYPVTGAERINYESSFNGSAIFRLEIDGKKVTLINNHLESNRITSKDKEFYQSLRQGNIGAETLGSLKDNIVRRLKPAFIQRGRQADAIAQKIKEQDSDYMLVCGDFNDTPISYAHHKIKGSLKDAFVEHGNGLGISYNADYFWFRLDYILHSPKIKSYRCYVDRSIKTSDHYPVIALFSLDGSVSGE